jgi:acetyl/propionyl-CoA carboxylase alpha subunit
LDGGTPRILIANRGEIAVRIARACLKLGVDFVCIYTAEDAQSGHVRLAREHGAKKGLYRVSSYHDANELLAVADDSGAEALHPGYGFFAEDYRFARRMRQRERPLNFIGPSWQVIRDLGDKINTKRLARSLGVPTVPGSDKPIYDEMEAEKFARTIYEFQLQQGIEHPVILVKASAGGGGMGIEEVHDIDLFRSIFRRIRNYAARQFKDEGVLIEQRIRDFNHLEVQILAEREAANIVHFGTRNCSIQSDGLQKRLEAAPGFAPASISYSFDAQKLLDTITAHSLVMAKAVKYDNIGTWEWIVTRDGAPYLMEVNARVQVENGVSAAVTRIRGEAGTDLMAEQIRTALGQPLGYSQEDISFAGSSLEYRIIAEDPKRRFSPWVGRIEKFQWEDKDWLSLHTHVPTDEPYDIPTEFDPNLALGIVWGKDLEEAKMRGLEFLDGLILEGRDAHADGLKSNVDFLRARTEGVLLF